MARNRSKDGKLASECPNRISKFVNKYRKTESYIRDLKHKLKLPAKKQELVWKDSEISLVIDYIKKEITILKSEARDLEKKLGISRKQSDLFQGKNHRSKVDKLRGRK